MSKYTNQADTRNPLVSVIIPTHNRAVLLSRAIQSVQQQTYSNLEVIVVDDASKDNTREVVERHQDGRIRYIRHESNKGGGATRNTGIRTASGKYIAFLDDDDEWELEKTSEQLKILENYDVVACTTNGIGDNLEKLNSRKFVDLVVLQRGPWGGTGVLMGEASIFKEIMFDESLPRGQDWDLFIRIALKHRIAYLNKPLLRYDAGTHPRITNSVPNVPIVDLEKQFRIVQKYKDLFGTSWYQRHMCQGLLYGIKDRRDKIELLVYAASRYGLVNVVRTLAQRVWAKVHR